MIIIIVLVNIAARLTRVVILVLKNQKYFQLYFTTFKVTYLIFL